MLFHFSDKDRRTDRWIRRKNTAQPPPPPQGTEPRVLQFTIVRRSNCWATMVMPQQELRANFSALVFFVWSSCQFFYFYFLEKRESNLKEVIASRVSFRLAHLFKPAPICQHKHVGRQCSFSETAWRASEEVLVNNFCPWDESCYASRKKRQIQPRSFFYSSTGGLKFLKQTSPKRF